MIPPLPAISQAPPPPALSFKFVPQRDPSPGAERAREREREREREEEKRRLRATLAADVPLAQKMESDTTVRRIKAFGTQNYVAQENDGSPDRCGNNGYSDDPKRKPEVSLYLLREGLAASLVSVFILVLWGLVHFSLQQLVIGKPTGDFSAVRAR